MSDTGTREVFIRAWQKYRAGAALDGIEKLIVSVAIAHPEYHVLLDDPEAAQRSFPAEAGESNPFLHMGMHIAIEESIATDRPAGITVLYPLIVKAARDPHDAQHHMLECLGAALWEAGRHGTPPDEEKYLECLRRLAG
jgi:hypothetical protein